ncbi:putative Sodium/dicarboxylate symporter [Elsinoe ampelina]|uniref:Amino acid transporter n=1 Tax=Elsinoe ampelina TaxID=302913 RepID=A0A6A6GLZ1_9PEZI|nr:putative Sodium/dicarboxylate symporter [Elsinoe ampelina]
MERRASSPESPVRHEDAGLVDKPGMPWGTRLWGDLLTPGHALQIIAAGLLAIAIGLAVVFSTGSITDVAPALLEIPGSLWLRALRATVLSLIITAIILAVQTLKEMANGGAKLARWTIGWYLVTTIIAIVHSVIAVSLGWRRLMQTADEASLNVDASDQADIEENSGNAPHDIVVQVFESFIPSNVFNAMAEDELLAVLVAAVVVGALLKGPDSSILRAVREIERLITIIIVFLIKLAPIGVFSLILANLMTLDPAAIGINLDVLIGASLVVMFIQLYIVLPALFFIVTRENPYASWMKCSPSWITDWGSASSAATLPVTMRVLRQRAIPETVVKFTAPLGALVNMDGTAIYFPVVVAFLAETQGITLNTGQYVIVFHLATLSSIATTPIPSSSLMLKIMIANSVDVPITGMYAVVVAIDWFIDRFRTATNVSGDLYAARALEEITGIGDGDDDRAGLVQPDQEVLDDQAGAEKGRARDSPV